MRLDRELITMDLKTFGKRLKTLRVTAGLSQTRLVDQLTTIYGRSNPGNLTIDSNLFSKWETAYVHRGRQWVPSRQQVLYLIECFANYLTVDEALTWAAQAGHTLKISELPPLFSSGSNWEERKQPAQEYYSQQLPSPFLDRAIALYDYLTHLFPREYRDNFGDELVDIFQCELQAASERGVWSLARFAALTLYDLPGAVLEAHYNAIKEWRRAKGVDTGEVLGFRQFIGEIRNIKFFNRISTISTLISVITIISIIIIDIRLIHNNDIISHIVGFNLGISLTTGFLKIISKKPDRISDE